MSTYSNSSKLCCTLTAIMASGVLAFLMPAFSSAQESYRVVPMIVYEKKPVTITRWVDETVSQKQTVTSYKPVWQTETRERTQTVYKPIQETAERLEKVVLRKPVVETLMRNVTREETTYETMTKYRDEEYTVRVPQIETQMRTEEYTVSKPVTKRLVEVKKTTTYKPVLKSETHLVPTELPVIQMGARPDPSARPRMQMLRPGYYTDPVSGATVYRKRGLHWVQPTISEAATTGTIPALIPQQYGKLSFVPETKEERKPIEITRYVDEVKTRKVPIEVKRMVERTKTRRVPYEVKIPKTVVTTEQVPYTHTTYKEETITKRVPYTRTRLQKVVTTEPYEVEVPRWISVTKEIEVPKTVARKVQKTYMQDVPKTVMMKVPLDFCGNPTGPPQSLYSTVAMAPSTETASTDSNLSIATGSTLNKPLTNFAPDEGSSVITRREVIPTESRGYEGKAFYDGFVEREPKTLDETSKSVLKSDANESESGESKSPFKEIVPTDAVPADIDNITPRRPRTTPWQTVDPFGETSIISSETSNTKTLVETAKRQESEPSTDDTDYTDLLESPSKPAADVEPGLSGDEKAADLGR